MLLEMKERTGIGSERASIVRPTTPSINAGVRNQVYMCDIRFLSLPHTDAATWN